MATRTWRSFGVVTLIAVTAVSACGGGASAKKVDPAADLASAKTAVITAADLPGYTQKPYKSSDSDMPKSAKQAFAKCLNVATTMFDTTPGAQTADSPYFDKDQAEVQASVEIDPTRADISSGWSDMSKTGSEGCFGKLIESALRSTAPAGATYGKVTATRFNPGIGNRSLGYAVTIPVTANGQDIVFYFDLVAVARDRAGITLSGFNPYQPYDRATEIMLARKMYDRVGNRAA